MNLQQKMKELVDRELVDREEQNQMKNRINRFNKLDQFNRDITSIMELVQRQDQIMSKQIENYILKSRNKVIRIFNQNKYNYRDLRELEKSETILNINYIGKMNEQM